MKNTLNYFVPTFQLQGEVAPHFDRHSYDNVTNLIVRTPSIFILATSSSASATPPLDNAIDLWTPCELIMMPPLRLRLPHIGHNIHPAGY